MSQAIITVEGLGKRYTLRHRASGSGLLRDRIARFVRSPWHRPADKEGDEEFWALRNLAFTVNQGEVIGIVGRNGAGKSTLLKILSRITEPTTGRIAISGRVASLLEVGTGFHGELSGRENVFLNGAILGMTRAEIRRKFDEIVAFAEVEKFLDTPVKHYSSGMYVRLAFAVAAHLEPEILIVDEVLAVGDQAFQKRCLGKIENVTKQEGRTVLFVSHNLASVRQLCSRAFLLERGQLLCQGSPSEVIGRYVSDPGAQPKSPVEYRHIRGDHGARIERISFRSTVKGEALYSIFEPVTIEIAYSLKTEIKSLEFFVLIYADDGECLAAIFQKDSGALTVTSGLSGTARVSFENSLAPGRYLVSAGIFDNMRQFLDWVEFADAFQVEPGFADGQNYDHRLGRMSIKGNWTT